MTNLFKILLSSLFTLVFANDGEGPLFTNIIPIEDFFYGNSIQIDIQAFDQDGIDEIILYYRFSKNENYKNAKMDMDINYSSIISGFEITSDKIEYYFLGIDKFKNQRKYPENGDSNPLTISILKQFENQNSDFYEINLITPLENSKSEDVSILILSLYSKTNDIFQENIEIILDNKTITDNCNISNELITYVPLDKLASGSHELIFKLINKEINNNLFIKKFYFDLLKSDELVAGISTASWIDDITYSGNINYSSDYDQFNYKNINTTQSRPLDVHRINFTLKSRYKWIDLKSSILFNTHIIDGNARANKKYNQPIDRMKIGINFPYGNFNFGDYSTTFSDLILKGTRVRGLHTSIKIGFLKITYIRGKSKELIQSKHWIQEEVNNPDLPGILLNDSTFLYYEKGTPSRNLRALRTEFNFGKRFNIGFNGLTSYDAQDVDVPYEPLYSNYLFIGNSVIGVDGTLFFNNKRTWLSMETAISITNDIREENINNYLTLDKDNQAIIGVIEELLGYPLTTDLLESTDRGRGISLKNLPIEYDSETDTMVVKIDSEYLSNIIKEGTYKIKFKSPFSFYNIQFNLYGEYKRIPPNFVSFGSPSVPKDIQGLLTSLKLNLLNNKITINLGYHDDNDNVNDYKLTMTSSTGNSIGMNFNFNKLPNINYSRKFLERNDSGGFINNKTITHTITPAYKFNIGDFRNIGLNMNFVIMNYYDNILSFTADDSSLINNNFTQLSFSNSLSLKYFIESKNQLSFNIGSGYSNNKPKDITKSETKFLAFSSKISYTLKNNKLSSYVGLNTVSGENEGENPIKNRRNSIKIGSQYKLTQYSSIKYNFEYLLFFDDEEPNNNYSEIKGTLTFKINF